jgi:glycosyltransferase involved in cell wall biosynthesis
MLQRKAFSSEHKLQRFEHRPTPLPSLTVIDDSPVQRSAQGIEAGRSDFYRFAMLFDSRVDTLTLCMPVFDTGPNHKRRLSAIRLGKNAKLAAMYPYRHVTDYIRQLPQALVRNVPTLRREISVADLVWIRLPAANGPLAFILAKIYRKPVVVFLVAYPAAGEFAADGPVTLRSVLVRVATYMEWQSIAVVARKSLVFAYGNDLAARLRAKGASRVHVTFTSLVDIIPPAIPEQRPAPETRLLFAGRFAPEKGIDLILDAAHLLIDQGHSIHVDLVGDGPLAEQLRRHPFVTNYSSVTFHGWIHDDTALDRFFQRADIFVHPSRSEGIPKVLLKAMAHGLPIVTTTVGGIPDIVTDGLTGLLIPPNNAPLVAEAIKRLISEPAYSRRLGGSARKYAGQHTSANQADSIWLKIQNTYPEIFPSRND